MPTTEPCQCQLQARRELEYAPEPPAGKEGKLAYGYLIEHPMAEIVLRKEIGNRKTDLSQKVGVFKDGCQAAITPKLWPGGLKFQLRADIEEEDYNPETMRGYLILVANLKTRVIPPKEELAKLEAYLETDAKPRWCEVL
ncbi:hypothetical protein SCHPADRAFT_907955 [Schizopora paradoxa]|uniref:Uncharacterized protein n=1 Tax=Schizopora paradoxa TaxID=27342 RepID=A0A0H2RWJ4_9AGAM|nr:hypothetical protein SCHPADRAFT_907955 [Schizopora paradoxa]